MADVHSAEKSTNVRSNLGRLAAFGVARAFTWAPSVSASAALYLWTHPQRRTRPAREASILDAATPIRIPMGMGSLAGWRWTPRSAAASSASLGAQASRALPIHTATSAAGAPPVHTATSAAPVHTVTSAAGAHTGHIATSAAAVHTATSAARAPTVLLVHGWEGRGSQLGSFVEPLVEAGYSVVSFDAPAHGDSEGERASLIRFADAIDAAVRCVGPVHGIVAHSMGGAATLLAISGGLDVKRLVLVAPADPSHAIARFSDAVGIPDTVQARMEDDLVTRYGAGIRTFGAPVLAAGSPAPALVIHDHADRWVPIADGHAYADARPDFVLVETNGLGHHRILRDPGVIASAVRYLGGADAVPVEIDAPERPPALPTGPLDAITITEEEILADLSYGR